MNIEAVFENGVLRPVQPLPFHAGQHVIITVHLAGTQSIWPDKVVAIYREIAEQDRRLAEAFLSAAQETWPVSGDQP